MTKISNAELEEWKRELEEITQANVWLRGAEEDGSTVIYAYRKTHNEYIARNVKNTDAPFISEAPQRIRRLIERVHELESKLSKAAKMQQRYSIATTTMCVDCRMQFNRLSAELGALDE